MEEGSNKKVKLSLDSQDWKSLLDNNDDDGDPPALVVTKTGGDDLPEIDSGESNRFNTESMTYNELAKFIEGKRSTYKTMACKLPDKGRKIMDMITSLEKEKERRQRNQSVLKDTRSVEMEEEEGHERNWRTVKDNSGSDMPAHPQSSGIKGKSTGVKQVAPPSSRPQSQFGSLFCHKVEEDQANRAPAGAFGNQLKALGRCDRRKTGLNGQVSPKETRLNSQVLPEETRPNGQVSPKERWGRMKSRKTAFQSPGFFSGNVKNKYTSNGAVNTSPSSLDIKENSSGYSSRFALCFSFLVVI